jgi:hypothetical protein
MVDRVKHTATRITTLQTLMLIVLCTRAAILLDGMRLDYYMVISKTGSDELELYKKPS